MESLLFQVVSAVAACFVFCAWLRPKWFRYLLDKGTTEPSVNRVGQFTALVTSTWAFVAIVLRGQLSEWFFTAYMLAWAAAQFGSVWLKSKGMKPPEGTS